MAGIDVGTRLLMKRLLRTKTWLFLILIYYPIPVPMFGVLVLNGHVGANGDVREGTGVLIVLILRGLLCGKSLLFRHFVAALPFRCECPPMGWESVLYQVPEQFLGGRQTEKKR